MKKIGIGILGLAIGFALAYLVFNKECPVCVECKCSPRQYSLLSRTEAVKQYRNYRSKTIVNVMPGAFAYNNDGWFDLSADFPSELISGMDYIRANLANPGGISGYRCMFGLDAANVTRFMLVPLDASGRELQSLAKIPAFQARLPCPTLCDRRNQGDIVHY